MSRTWFVTGSAKGLGRVWTEAALNRGDKVAATARNPEALADLICHHGDRVLPIGLDVTNREAVFAAMQHTASHFGSIDIVVNNAGYGHFGMVEELEEPEIRQQMETNFFGALWVVQAALPIMRAQGSGHLVQVTSEGGILAFPGIGAYHASKWALEGLSESLWQEVEPFGIHVTNVEPGPYATDWLSVGSQGSAQNDDYNVIREKIDGYWELGDPAATAAAMLAVVDAERPPHRIFFGRSYEAVSILYGERMQTWSDWQSTSLAAFG